MAISVDWENKIVFIPRNDLTLIQSTPTEIRELDIDNFRLELKSLEATEGMPYLDIHRHNPPTNVGGVALARVVEIINDYTITFEDGQYAVNLTGANSNVGDRVNVNQVSVRSANSAGLIQVEGGAISPLDVARAVWDREQSLHTQPGSMGDQMKKAVTSAGNAFAVAASKV